MKALGILGVAIAMAGFTLLIAPILNAKDAPAYDKGLLVSMDSSKCGRAENGGKSVTG